MAGASPVFSGIGLVLGYALLGEGWLMMKTEGALREWARERFPWLVILVLAVLVLAFDAAVFERARKAIVAVGRKKMFRAPLHRPSWPRNWSR